MKIQLSQATEVAPHSYVTEASDLGLRGWPKSLDTDEGNGQPLIAINIERDVEGDIQFVVYRQQFGCIQLHVFND